MIPKIINFENSQTIGAAFASALSLIKTGIQLSRLLRVSARVALFMLLLLTGTTLTGVGGPSTAPEGFPLQQPTPPPAPAIGSVFTPTDYLATSGFPKGFWPGPAISAFPALEIGRTADVPGSLSATDLPIEFQGLSVPTLRQDRLVIVADLAWPTSASGRYGGQLWLVFGGSPLGGATQIIQGPRSFAPFGGILGNQTTVPAVITPTFFFGNSPPKAYAFDIILTDLDGVWLMCWTHCGS